MGSDMISFLIIWFWYVQGSMCIGHLIMASAVTGSLYAGSIIVGVCYGAQWSLMPAAIRRPSIRINT
uniref:Uncharacterized protein n=1 Tax=Physcomitrium patens TaxID=3218 RepID=A0A7I3ZM65_PHYPA